MENIRTQTLEDSFKSDSSLNRIKLVSWQLADSHQVQSAITLFLEFLQRQTSIDCHREFAKFLSVFDSPSAALKHLKENLAWLSSFSSAEQLARAQNEIASYYRQVGEYSAARRAQQQAIRHDLARTESDGLLAQTLFGQACDLFVLQEFEPAKYLLISLLKQTDEIGILTRLKLAEIYLGEDEIVAAKLMLNEAIEICERKDQINFRVQALSLLSRASEMNDEFNSAVKYSDEALSIAKKSARCVNEVPSLQEEAQKLRMKMRLLCQTPQWN